MNTPEPSPLPNSPLLRVPDGLYNGINPNRKWWQIWKPRKLWSGWWEVERNNKEIMLLWTSHRNHHCGYGSPAIGLYVNRKGELTMYCKSILSMHIEWSDSGRGSEDKRLEGMRHLKWAEKCLTPFANKEHC